MAAQVFQARGYDAGSLDDVAVRLDLRRASLYHYVRSKAELLYLVFDQAISVALEQIDAFVHDEDAPTTDRLAALIRHQVRTITGDLSLFTVFFDQRPHLDDEYEAAIRLKERQYVRVWAETVRQAAETGVLGDVDPRYAAQVLLGITNWTYKWFDPARDDQESFADVAVAMVLGNPSERGPT